MSSPNALRASTAVQVPFQTIAVLPLRKSWPGRRRTSRPCSPGRPGRGTTSPTSTALGAVEHAVGGLVVRCGRSGRRRSSAGTASRRRATTRRCWRWRCRAGSPTAPVAFILASAGVELVRGPRLVDGRDADVVLLEHRLAGEHRQRDVVVADGVGLVVVACRACSAGTSTASRPGRRAGRDSRPTPSSARSGRRCPGCRAASWTAAAATDGLVVRVLRERLHLDLVLGLAGVVVGHDLVDRREFGLVAGVVGPHRQLTTGPAGRAAGALGTGGHRERERGREQVRRRRAWWSR